VEGVQPVRQVVFTYFKNHFISQRVARPNVGNLQFKILSRAEMSNLTKHFSMEEIKAAEWGCDSFKSLGPDGINFGFIKNFWIEMKDDIV